MTEPLHWGLIATGALFAFIFILTCILSIRKAISDRKKIKARIAARKRREAKKAARKNSPPKNSPNQSPKKSPNQSPNKSPNQSPNKSPNQTPKTSLNKTPNKPPNKSSNNANRKSKDGANNNNSQVQQEPGTSGAEMRTVTRVSAPRSVTYEMASQEPRTVPVRNGSATDTVFIPRGRDVTYSARQSTSSLQRHEDVRIAFLEDYAPRAPLADAEETTSDVLSTVSSIYQEVPRQSRPEHRHRSVTRGNRPRIEPQRGRKTRSYDRGRPENEQPIEVLINPRRFSYAAAIDAQYELELGRLNQNNNFASTDDILQVYRSSPGQRRAAGRENLGFEERDL